MKGDRWYKILKYINEGPKHRRGPSFITAFMAGATGGFSAEAYEQLETSKAISRLKKQGFIARGKFWRLTEKGKEKLRQFMARLKNRPAPRSYKPNREMGITIVSYDIPVKENYWRDWLRSALKNLEFKMLQESVWIGECALPKDFIKDLKEFRIFKYLEIFAVTRTGTIKKLS